MAEGEGEPIYAVCMKLNTKVLFCLDREMYDALQAAKLRTGRSVSSMLREAVKTLLRAV